MRRPFQEDVAYIHHNGFGGFATDAAPGLLRLLKTEGAKKGLLVDLACGSGIWARRAQQAGYEVLGIDASSAMIRMAQKIARGSQFRCASLHKALLPRCDAITIIGEGLNYLSIGEAAPPPATIFGRLAAALKPGGVLIFDVILTGKPLLNRRLWNAGTDWAILVDMREFPNRRLLLREITTFRNVKGNYRRGSERHTTRLFRRQEMEAALRKAGFTFRILNHYGKMPLLTRRAAFVCRKRLVS